jgi:hypothetical protein
MATILSILDYSLDDGVLTVEAVVDEMLLYRSASYYEPEEWVAGMCSAQYELAEGETFPETEKQQIAFLEDLDLDWELIDYE